MAKENRNLSHFDTDTPEDSMGRSTSHVRVASSSLSVVDVWAPTAIGEQIAKVVDPITTLVKDEVVSAEALSNARRLAEQSPGKSVLQILRDNTDDDLHFQTVIAKASSLQIRRLDWDSYQAITILRQLGADYCLENQVVPIVRKGLRVEIGLVDPSQVLLLDEIRTKLKSLVHCSVITPSDLTQLIERFNEDDQPESTEGVSDIIADIDDEDVEVVEETQEDIDLEKAAEESPVVRLVNYIIAQAVREGASDIHIEPMDKRLQVRFRIDGVLFDAMNPPAAMRSPIVSRLKIMANLDISERRLPQDGRIRCMIQGRQLDLRMSTLPVNGGEKVVMRILDNRAVQVQLDDLGFSEDMLLIWKNQIKNPHGIILVTGPTGSGKTTTLYSSLNQMDRSKLNISTVEDPVEYHLDGINQTQTHERIGMTFASALRALLRQDPDVVMVGEIRDMETSKIAIQASLTGHLVLSTLHTNDAPSSVTRLINIGVEPFLIGSAVNSCLAQRLVRKICPHCRESVKVDDNQSEMLMMHGISADQITKGKGCDKCRNTGYSGRVGLYELLVLDDYLRDMIARNPNVTEFRRTCVERGMTTLRADGFDKVAKGFTTVDEVLRVTEANS